MSNPTLKCVDTEKLKSFLKSFNPKINDNLPYGQILYRFSDGLVTNVYTSTGTVTFQGKNTKGTISQKINSKINSINKS